MRQVVLDTETTGLDVGDGHRIIEVGCVEIVSRRLTRNHFHQYVNPQRSIDDGALAVHGITLESLEDKPVFADIWDELLEFIEGSELIMHNAGFDVEFLNEEIRLISTKLGTISDYCTVVDSLALARDKHPGQRNSLDALCKRYDVDDSQRDLHGALLDAELLADVFLLLTGGQVALSLGEEKSGGAVNPGAVTRQTGGRKLKVVRATADEIDRHEAKLDALDELSEGGSVWRQLDGTSPAGEGIE